MTRSTMTIDELVQLRRTLHAQPELSGCEKQTAATITAFIKQLKPDELLTDIGGHGILVCFDSGVKGSVLLFRADMDALPIQEVNTFSHSSAIQGVSHKCGHDGHSTMLCGLAMRLAAERPATGKVYLLFQPAEETGEGAQKIIDDPAFDLQPDFVFAIHNLPGYDTGCIVVKDGLFSAAVNSMIISLQGTTAHAAEPEMGVNPAIAVSKLISLAAAMNNNNPAADDFRLVTPVHIIMGEKAYGVSAGNAALHYTLRCWNNEMLKETETYLINEATKIAEEQGLVISINFTQSFFANNNDEYANNIVRKAAAANSFQVIERDFPFKWGEDFGLFTTKFKGCMFGIGAGIDHPALHNPDYDFPDVIIPVGVNSFHSITKLLLTTDV